MLLIFRPRIPGFFKKKTNFDDIKSFLIIKVDLGLNQTLDERIRSARRRKISSKNQWLISV